MNIYLDIIATQLFEKKTFNIQCYTFLRRYNLMKSLLLHFYWIQYESELSHHPDHPTLL